VDIGFIEKIEIALQRYEKKCEYAKKTEESAAYYCICAFFIVILQPNVKFRDLCTKEYS
jgi:hypothetical protein